MPGWTDSSLRSEEREVQAAFTVRNGMLSVHSDMYWEMLGDFELACEKLLQSRKQTLTLDLTLVNFISSSFLGCLSNLLFKASLVKKRINLKVSLDVSWLFDIMGGRKNMEMEVV